MGYLYCCEYVTIPKESIYWQGEEIMKEKRESVRGKLWTLLMLAVLVLSLLPLMYVGRYNHPTGDDYYYGAQARVTWKETGSFIKTIGVAIEGVVEQYYKWQGTYSAMFLMYLPPYVFGEQFYGLITTILLLLLSGGIFYFLKPFICDLAGESVNAWIIISSILSLLCIQTVPSQGETFFWYNGSMYYTGFFAVTLFWAGLICRCLLKPKVYKMIFSWLGAFFLAGGNYVSLLPCLILLFCATLCLFIQKKRGKAVYLAITFGVMLTGFLISALAPGNAVRQNGMWKTSAHIAILKSLLQGLRYVKAWIGLWWILCAIILMPVFWRSYKKKMYRFQWPVVVIGFVYGVFCSMSCPLFYTMNSTGPARAVAIIYYAFVISTFFCYYYLLGYVHRVLAQKKPMLCEGVEEKYKKAGFCVWGILALVFIGIQMSNGKLEECSTAKAMGILVSGEARAYHDEYLMRMEILNDSGIQNVVFEPYANQPDMLYVGDLQQDAQDPINQQFALIYNKESIYVNY